jgi:hypothetical protein
LGTLVFPDRRFDAPMTKVLHRRILNRWLGHDSPLVRVQVFVVCRLEGLSRRP